MMYKIAIFSEVSQLLREPPKDSPVSSQLDVVNKLTEQIGEALCQFLFILSDYYVLAAIICTAVCTVWAVLARKNKGSRRRAVFLALFGPFFLFSLYIATCVYSDINLCSTAYQMINDEYAFSLPDVSCPERAYKTMYHNTRALYSAYGETTPGLTFNFHFTFGTLFISTAVWFAVSSVLYGLTLRFICVRNVSLKKWSLVGLIILIPLILIIGAIIYRASFASGILYKI